MQESARNILVARSEGKRPHWISRCGWEDNNIITTNQRQLIRRVKPEEAEPMAKIRQQASLRQKISTEDNRMCKISNNQKT
jgi:hypothetical protein